MFGDHARLKLQALVEAQREIVDATLICRPRDEYLTAVGADGVLVTQSPGGFETRARLSPMSGEAPCAIEQFMDDPRVPIVSTVLDYRDGTLELNAVGHVDSDGRRLDVVRWRLSSRPEFQRGGKPYASRSSVGTASTSLPIADCTPSASPTRVVTAASIDGWCTPNGSTSERRAR
jgi:hypothetical protein